MTTCAAVGIGQVGHSWSMGDDDPGRPCRVRSPRARTSGKTLGGEGKRGEGRRGEENGKGEVAGVVGDAGKGKRVGSGVDAGRRVFWER